MFILAPDVVWTADIGWIVVVSSIASSRAIKNGNGYRWDLGVHTRRLVEPYVQRDGRTDSRNSHTHTHTRAYIQLHVELYLYSGVTLSLAAEELCTLDKVIASIVSGLT